jgi:hypothetical protein
VLEETGVLRGNEGSGKHPGHLGQRNDGPPLHKKFPDQHVILGIDRGDDIRVIIFQRGQPGKIEDDGKVKGYCGPHKEEDD